MVHFVGAGPGAKDLITVRGQRAIENADVIIYNDVLTRYYGLIANIDFTKEIEQYEKDIKDLKIKEGAFANVVRFVSPLTFGIYLIHEHDLVRGFWNEIMCVSRHGDKPYMLIHFAVSVALVFVVCAIIELGRKTVTDLIFKIPPIKFLMNKLSKVDRFFNAERED